LGTLELARLRLGEDPEGEGRLVIEGARVAGLDVRAMTVPIAWKDGILRAEPLTGSVYGGRLVGRVAIHTRPPVAFEGSLRVEGLSLERLVADVGHGRPEVRGTAAIDVEFQSRSGAFRDFTASGGVSICGGDLGDLPVIANIPALLASVLPFSKPPTFERADLTFTVADEAIVAESLTLSGPLFDMHGYGTLDFLGNLDLTLTPQFLKSFFLPGSLQLPVVKHVVGLLHEDPLYVVRIRGDVASAKPILVPFPMLGPRRDAPPEFQGTPFQGAPARRVPRWFR
jgi:hypothetical protein